MCHTHLYTYYFKKGHISLPFLEHNCLLSYQIKILTGHSYSILNLYHLNFWLFYICLSYYSQLNHLVLCLNWMMGWFSTMLLSASWSAFFSLGFLLTCHVFLFSLYISTYILTSISSDFFFPPFGTFLFE